MTGGNLTISHSARFYKIRSTLLHAAIIEYGFADLYSCMDSFELGNGFHFYKGESGGKFAGLSEAVGDDILRSIYYRVFQSVSTEPPSGILQVSLCDRLDLQKRDSV